jgi:ubiquinone biosynthesis protein
VRGALAGARDMGRARQIATVLVRHGLSDSLRRSGLSGLLDRATRALHLGGGEFHPTTPQHFRGALEELGPTFVKLGQLLAGRSDLLPPEWTSELARLHESAAPVPWEELRAQLHEDLGAEPEQVFPGLEREPIAAASIAQVHAARLPDGTPVVLKVRRPGIREKVDADLRLMDRLAAVVEKESRDLARYAPRALVHQLARSLRDELDLRIEARHAERLARQVQGRRELVIPRVHARWTRERLLVLDRLEGPSVGRWLADPGRDVARGRQLARDGAQIVLEMVLEHGFYHADPHPGNVLFLDDGRIGLVDFGMVGRLSEGRRREFSRLMAAVVDRDVDTVVDVLSGWARAHDTDLDALTQDCAAFVDRYHGVPIGELDMRALLTDVAAIVRENDLALPPDISMLLKVFVTLEALGRALDPDFDMATQAEPFVRRLLLREHAPWSVARKAVRDLAGAAAGLPDDLRGLLRNVRRGRIRLDLDLERLERVAHDLDRSATRVTLGLVVAALIVGTAIASTVQRGPTLLGLPILATIGFVSSVVAGVFIVGSIRRSRRR